MNQNQIVNNENLRWYRCNKLKIGILEESNEVINEIRSTDQYKKALKYCSLLFEKQVTINKKYTSYGLKHDIEWYIIKHRLEENSYISNDDFILAMDELGFECKKIKGSQSYMFNVKRFN